MSVVRMVTTLKRSHGQIDEPTAAEIDRALGEIVSPEEHDYLGFLHRYAGRERAFASDAARRRLEASLRRPVGAIDPGRLAELQQARCDAAAARARLWRLGTVAASALLGA